MSCLLKLGPLWSCTMAGCECHTASNLFENDYLRMIIWVGGGNYSSLGGPTVYFRLLVQKR